MLGNNKFKELKIICFYAQSEKDCPSVHAFRPVAATVFQDAFGFTGRTRVGNGQSSFLQAFELEQGGELGVFSLGAQFGPQSDLVKRLERCVDGYAYLLSEIPKTSSVDDQTVLKALDKIEQLLLLNVNNQPPTFPLIRTALLD